MIYFDNAATTKCTERTLEIVKHYLQEDFYNPSASYRKGVYVKSKLMQARETILATINGSGKVIFTSGGTESDVTAILGAKKKPRSKIIISNTEHSAVYQTAMHLKTKGFEVCICPTDSSGKVLIDKFRELIDDSVSLVSIIHVNNETGAINDIKELVKITKDFSTNILFHSDGVQAIGKIKVDLEDLAIDFYSFSAHKIGGMKGCGGLFIRDGLFLAPLIFGGGQEYGLRSSTENVPAIISMANAITDKHFNLNENFKNIQKLYNNLCLFFENTADFKVLSNDNGSPYILSVTSKKIKGEILQHSLEDKNIIIGVGSACSSNKPSRRISEALGLNSAESEGILRISFSSENSIEQVEIFKHEFLKCQKELSKYAN